MGKFAQGASNERYCVISRVLVFPIDGEGKILLLKGSPSKKIWAGLWNGIGGHVEAGESLLQAAKRELAEETGLIAAQWQFCGQVMVDVGSNPGIAFHVFTAKGLDGELKASDEGELDWFVEPDLLKLPLVEDLYTLVPMVARMGPGDKPFWGIYTYDHKDQLIMRFSR